MYVCRYLLNGILVTMIREEMRRPQTMSRRECMPRYSRQLHTRRVHDLIKISESRRINFTLLTVL